MKKAFYLKTCNTCKRILSSLNLEGWQLQELKTEPLTPGDLEKMYQLAGSYKALFSKRSTQIKARGIEVAHLTEEDYRALLLDHYSFLKRPVFLTEDQIFIGNNVQTIAAVAEYIQNH